MSLLPTAYCLLPHLRNATGGRLAGLPGVKLCADSSSASAPKLCARKRHGTAASLATAACALTPMSAAAWAAGATTLEPALLSAANQ